MIHQRYATPTLFLEGALAVRLAVTGLARSRGTTALAVGILALGLAAPTVFFSLLVGATRPLPVPEGDQVVRIDVVQPARDGRALPAIPGDLRALSGSQALEALGVFRVSEATLVDADVAATRVSLAELSPEVLALLRVTPSIGRVADLDDAERTVLIGHDVWMELYDGDPVALGRPVTIAGVSRIIVGVMPEGLVFLSCRTRGWCSILVLSPMQTVRRSNSWAGWPRAFRWTWRPLNLVYGGLGRMNVVTWIGSARWSA